MRKLDFKNVFQINLTEISYDITRKTPFCSNETWCSNDIIRNQNVTKAGDRSNSEDGSVSQNTPTLAIFIITHCIFLGFKFLVRNKEKNEIPCQGMRKIQGIFLPTFLCNLSKRWIKKGAQNFPKKSPYSWNTIFDPSYNFY